MNETSPPRRRWGSLGALFAGLLAIVVLSTATDLALHRSGVFPPEGQPMVGGLWVLATAYRVVYAVAGCYLAARLAPDRPLWHALALGWIGVVLSTFGTVATWGMGHGAGLWPEVVSHQPHRHVIAVCLVGRGARSAPWRRALAGTSGVPGVRAAW